MDLGIDIKDFMKTSLRVGLKVFFVCISASFVLFSSIYVFAKEKPVSDIENFPVITTASAGESRGFVVKIDGKQVVWILKDLGPYSSNDRAIKIAQDLNDFVRGSKNPQLIKPYKTARNVVVKAGDKILFTADKLNAEAFGVSQHELAYTWANATRKALGASELVKDYSDFSIGFHSINKKTDNIGQKIIGLASWYGAPFHGRTSSDGSRYNKNEFTAAHKSLPFGTLVKVKNLKNKKDCVVKITDRGPYVGNRVIDLSKKTAEQLGMLSKGVQKVELEIVGQY